MAKSAQPARLNSKTSIGRKIKKCEALKIHQRGETNGNVLSSVESVLKKHHRPGDSIAHTPNDAHEDVEACRVSESRAPPDTLGMTAVG